MYHVCIKREKWPACFFTVTANKNFFFCITWKHGEMMTSVTGYIYDIFVDIMFAGVVSFTIYDQNYVFEKYYKFLQGNF